MYLKVLGTAMAALAIITGPADAETRLAAVPNRFLVIPPMEAGSKRIVKGEIAFEFPLRWENAVILTRDLEVSADDRKQTLRLGQALVETMLRFTDPSFANAKSFCVPRLADPAAKGGFLARSLLGGAIARSMSDGQFCIVDREANGIAGYSVLVNAGSPAAREPRPMTALPYTLSRGAIVSEGDRVKIRYRGGKDSFELQIVEQGRPRIFQIFEYRDQIGRHRFNRWLFGDKITDGTYSVSAPGITFKANDYDSTSSSILIEWPKVERPVVVPIPDEVRIRYGLGY